MDRIRGYRNRGEIDLRDLGLLTGLEVHRQIKGRKLFCHCDSSLKSPDEYVATVSRKLNPALSETGGLDDAAAREMMRGSGIGYQVTSNCCLVDLDEEPPHPPSEFAVKTAFIVSLMMKTDLPDELVFMRKIVVDGSNPAGFQRTSMIGFGGSLPVNDTNIGIESVCLEEDSARKMGQEGDTRIFRLDRLGTPEIEITTSPSDTSPETVRDAALRIGSLLRSTGRFKRGIGTVRQDVNVSIKGGSRVEIKHVQDPDLIPVLIRKEAVRQRLLLDAAEILSKRNPRMRIGEKDIFDLTAIFGNSDSEKEDENKPGETNFGIRLRGFGGLLTPLIGEFVGRIKTVHGTDPGLYTMKVLERKENEDIFENAMKKMQIDPQKDEMIVIGGDEKTVRSIIEIVVRRAEEAFMGVPPEVRRALPGGDTEFLRPIAGEMRMYPETDLGSIPVTETMIAEARELIPGSGEGEIEDLVRYREIGRETATQIYEKDLAGTFRSISTDSGSGPAAARILLSILPEIFSKQEVETFVSEEMLRKVVNSINEGVIAKEAASDIFKELKMRIKEKKNSGDEIKKKTVEEILDSLISTQKGLKIDRREAREIIRNMANGKKDIIMEKGKGAKGPLMGLIMEELRGKIDGRVVSSLLDEELERILEMIT